MFFPWACAFSFEFFLTAKSFLFICVNRAPLFVLTAHKRMKMTHDKKNEDHIFFLCAYAFSYAKIHLSQKFSFYFLKLCISAPRINACKWHMTQKSVVHLFSLRLCVFICKDSSLSKVFFYFLKLCISAPRMNAWKWRMIKKISSTSVFFAPMRFQVQRFFSLNKISFLSHSTGCRHDRTNLKVPSESECKPQGIITKQACPLNEY